MNVDFNKMASAPTASSSTELVLITGATGFVASHIIKVLLEHNYRVRGTVRDLSDERKTKPVRDLFGDRIELVEADLLKSGRDGWRHAVAGCRYVIHVASPFPLRMPRNEDEVVRPALNGTLNVLNACVGEVEDERDIDDDPYEEVPSGVKRVVLTSSCCAMFGDRFEHDHDGHMREYTEKDWAEFRRLKPYAKSKVVAERAAWEFVKERKQKNLPCFELAVINPGYILVIDFGLFSSILSKS